MHLEMLRIIDTGVEAVHNARDDIKGRNISIKIQGTFRSKVTPRYNLEQFQYSI
jgi:hypothetical protein